jgi:hypothetical protein
LTSAAIATLLAIPGRDDPQALRRVGVLIAQALTAQQSLPEPPQVQQLLHVRVPTLTHPTVAQWLTVWLGGRKNISRNTYRSYESHLRLHLTRYLGSGHPKGVEQMSARSSPRSPRQGPLR